MMTPRKDPWANNRWVAAELEKIGHGARSALARTLGLPPSAVSNIVNNLRKISKDEFDAIEEFIDTRLQDGAQENHARPQRASRSAMRKTTISEVPVVGYVTAGAEEHRLPLSPGEFDMIAAPENVTDKTVAVQIRGLSMGALFDRWYAFYDDVRSPFTDDLVNALCVVGLADGRVMIKKVTPSRKPGFFNLLSENAPAIKDVRIEWAARVKSIAPR